ncbi:MAG: alpha/beta fold hydrolase [Acidimicrobiales bacterium]
MTVERKVTTPDGRVLHVYDRGGDDRLDLAAVAAPGFDVTTIDVPVLVVHGEHDRVVPASHARWLADRIPSAELWLDADGGHITVMDRAEAALAWIDEHRDTDRRRAAP